jgi:hypothetical protein
MREYKHKTRKEFGENSSNNSSVKMMLIIVKSKIGKATTVTGHGGP